MMVMEKPMQFTIVNAVPLDAAGAFCATKVENNGESAITTKPQKTRKPINKFADRKVKASGESKQQIQERSKAIKAIFLVPMC